MQHDVSHIVLALRGLPIVRAFRSAGSMIHFDFGALHERTNGRISSRYGEYGLMVEVADWTIEHQGAVLATADAWTRRVDGVLRKLKGARVRCVRFSNQSLRLSFDKGFDLSLSPSMYGRRYHLDNWVIFCARKPALVLTSQGRLAFPPA